MSGVLIKNVEPDEEGMRLDRWFKAHYPVLSHGRLEKLLRTGQIRIDGARAKSNTRLQEDQKVRVPPLRDSDAALRTARTQQYSAQDKDYFESLIIYRDDDLIALNKPAGLAVQGGSRTTRHVDQLAQSSGERGEKLRLVHRIDKATSGVLLMARTRQAAAEIGDALKRRAAKKIYWALVAGLPSPADGDIDMPLMKADRAGRERMAEAGLDAHEAKSAITRYATIEAVGQEFAWLALAPVTGRTHQLRVHLASIGHPIIGDFKYGRTRARRPGFAKQLHLHAKSIALELKNGRQVSVSAPLPEHMQKAWDKLGFGRAPEDPFGETWG